MIQSPSDANRIEQPVARSGERDTSEDSALPADGLPSMANARFAAPAPSIRAATPSHDMLLIGSNVQINGLITNQTVVSFMNQLGQVRSKNEDLILELMTTGGDADAARRIALEIRIFKSHSGREAYCVGKTIVYSAGITVLSAFDCANRYLTADTTLLVHERHVDKTLALSGPIKSTIQIVREELAALETAERIEKEDFAHFVEGSGLTTDELYDRAVENCYLSAAEALELRLVTKVLA